MNMTKLHFLDPNPTGRPTVLLLHGLGANGSSWTLQLTPLIEAGFRPIAPDAPGFGASPYDGKGWSVRRAAADTMDLLAELGVAPAHLVGISMGGTLALQLTLDFPRLVQRLVLVSTFAVLRPTKLSGWLYFFWRFVLVHTLGLPTQAKFVTKRIFPLPEQQFLRDPLIEQITQADVRAYRAAMRSLGTFNVLDRLGEIKIPTLVVTAENDTTVPPARQHLLVEGIAGARQVVISNAGHAVSVEQPGEFNRELLAFLKE
jgi:pimeloyl-ACP methyl ester carboxylesterase